jgi:hypothetical protein
VGLLQLLPLEELHRSKSLAALLRAAVLCAVIAAPPYATAWVKTGNPVFPYFNDVFRLPHYDVNPHWKTTGGEPSSAGTRLRRDVSCSNFSRARTARSA